MNDPTTTILALEDHEGPCFGVDPARRFTGFSPDDATVNDLRTAAKRAERRIRDLLEDACTLLSESHDLNAKLHLIRLDSIDAAGDVPVAWLDDVHHTVAHATGEQALTAALADCAVAFDPQRALAERYITDPTPDPVARKARSLQSHIEMIRALCDLASE